VEKVGFWATPGSKTPERITTKVGVHNYVGEPTLLQICRTEEYYVTMNVV